MNFTREPIIETIISPKEGCKLLVRSSSGREAAEEHYVDAIEVVSFGRAFFFRSSERPQAFLVPVSDYEIVEVKEPRVALKTGSHERHIKIGGGREAPLRHSPKGPSIEQEVEEEESPAEQPQDAEPIQARSDKRRDRRRRRHRRSPDDQEWTPRKEGAEQPQAEEPKPLPTLIPPPATLISQTLSRYKGKEFMDESRGEEKKPESSSNAESTSLQRTAVEDLPSLIENERTSYFF